MWTKDYIKKIPKVLLHDHLDGGVRSTTLKNIAKKYNYRLETSANQINSERKSLVNYLKQFDQTVALMQRVEDLALITAEAIEDLQSDGVVYAELRFAPELHCKQGLRVEDAIKAVGEEIIAKSSKIIGSGIVARLIITALRDSSEREVLKIADAACKFKYLGVVGFDIAGNEQSCSITTHKRAISKALEGGLKVSVHSGESGDIADLKNAIQLGATRIGHGVLVADSLNKEHTSRVKATKLRKLITEEKIVLEICPQSNVDTGIYNSIEDCPVKTLSNQGLRVTINTDNRSVSNTTLTDEILKLHNSINYSAKDVAAHQSTAAEAIFSDEFRESLVKYIKMFYNTPFSNS